ncbi:endonuclease MutS2 [Candidatus Binatus sp.]|uniref:endonuclease MutS2 n=1 Tax=Candidatus Binatus sp. TaxID=2811406 RepID=UPI003C752D4D
MRERDLKALEFDKVIHLVMERCASDPARVATAELRPSLDTAEVQRRLSTTAEMVDLRSHAGSIPISEFTDQRPYLLAAARAGAILGGEALVKVRDFIVGSRHVSGFLRSRVDRFPHVAALVNNLLAPKELADAMLSALADDGTLLDDASPELKRLRSRLRDERADLEARLLRSLNASGMESFISDYIVTIRNRRFVLPMKLNYSERFEGIVQDRSVSGETLFVEPMWAVDLNNRLMMLEREAEAEETRILARLTAMVGGYAPELQLTFDAMVALDALNARALFAERFRCVEPQLVDEGIDFIGARHPLLMTSGRDVIPIDVKIGAGQRGIVISGPNTGGKTVALKTVGLLSLMAQAGMLIPAEIGSKATVFRSVFADIGDEQSIESNLSSFSGHIANLSEIIRSLDEPALVILDEPGAGTDPAEGAALAIGLMNHLGTRRCMLAIATHSTAVKLHAYSQAGFEAAAVDFDAEHLAPLYRLKPHTIGQSYGLAVARRLGLPEEIIRAAEQSMGTGTVELTDSLKRLDAERAKLNAQLEKLRDRELNLAQIEQDVLQRAEKTSARAEADRKRLRAEVADLIEELRRDGAALIDDLKTRAKSRTDLKGFITKAAAKLESLAPAPDDAPGSDAPLKIGDTVQVGDIRGELIFLDAARAVISRGGLRIEVAPERLRLSAATAADNRTAQKKEAAVTFSVEGSDGIELNLIGMRTTDALRKLEEFLDTAFLTNRAEVRIVHGIGSGALRKAVADYLGTSPYCASFRAAEPHHGGAGATIVQMNL